MGKLIGYKVGKYARVYLSLLWIYVLNKFLGFLVDPEICQMEKVVWNLKLHLYQIILKHSREVCEMDKVVWNLFWVVRVRFCCKPGCQLLPTFPLIIICFGKKVHFKLGDHKLGRAFRIPFAKICSHEFWLRASLWKHPFVGRKSSVGKLYF